MTEPTRFQQVITSLFYPAFLGNVSYAAAEKLFKYPDFFSLSTSILVLALIFHYVMDWIYTISNPRERYGSLKFVPDLIIVICLYVALRLVLEEEGVLFANAWPWLSQAVYWLLITKGCAVAWELSESLTLSMKLWPTSKWVKIGTDLVFVPLYFMLGLFFTGKPHFDLYFAGVVLLDAGCYAAIECYNRPSQLAREDPTHIPE